MQKVGTAHKVCNANLLIGEYRETVTFILDDQITVIVQETMDCGQVAVFGFQDMPVALFHKKSFLFIQASEAYARNRVHCAKRFLVVLIQLAAIGLG
ncbi:hypothetical protein Z046_33020 [Pseudomonas aeruginosa VRFPA09]|nr:hypothetical protein Z046_33020 [Pseudomonas aeruginosa VRFPA09]